MQALILRPKEITVERQVLILETLLLVVAQEVPHQEQRLGQALHHLLLGHQ